MKINLFDFQQEDVDKLKSKKSRLVGNDPGTGKTYVGLALDQANRNGDGHPKVEIPRVAKTLIVAPKSVLSTWDEHCMDLTTEDIYMIDTSLQPAKAREVFLRDLLDKRKGGYFICHWDALRLLAPQINKKGIVFLHIIADEVHRAKNKKAQQTRALKSLKTWYKSGLSGTPADNRPQDIWSILNWLWPSYYTSFWDFVKAYIVMETTDEGYRKMVGVNPETIGRLRREMSPWYTRRRKEDVLPDLPNKYYTRIWVDLGPKQRRAYDEMRKTMTAWVEDNREALEREEPLVAMAAVAQLTRLQQFADGYMRVMLDDDGNIVYKMHHKGHKGGQDCTELCVEKPVWEMTDPSAKLDTLMDILSDRLGYNEETGEWRGEQIVVFSQSKQAIKLLEQRLVRKEIPHGVYTGDVSETDRTKIRHAFQNGDLRVFAGTIKAGGVGLTLTASSTIIFIDRDWSPSVNSQAEDRTHRIGQTEAVEVIDLMARNTVDLGKRQQLSLKSKHLQMLLGDRVLPELIIEDLEKEEAQKGNEGLKRLLDYTDDEDEDFVA